MVHRWLRTPTSTSAPFLQSASRATSFLCIGRRSSRTGLIFAREGVYFHMACLPHGRGGSPGDTIQIIFAADGIGSRMIDKAKTIPASAPQKNAPNRTAKILGVRPPTSIASRIRPDVGYTHHSGG